MLTFTNNVDRTDEAVFSNWPFTYESTLDTGDGTLTADSFLAISVNVDETVSLPCRFKGMTSDGRLVICDASGAEVCSGQIYEQTASQDICSFFLYDSYGVLCGFITCRNNVPQLLFSLSRYANGMHYFGTSAFVFLPQCHVQSMQGNVRSIGIKGKYSTANVTIGCTTDALQVHNVVPESNAQPLSFGVYNILNPEESRNKWCTVIVNGSTSYNVAGKHLIIKAGCTSNLRIVDTDAGIIFRGVQDV